MAIITGVNDGSIKEIFNSTLFDLKTQSDYLTAKIKDGNELDVQQANNRGLRIGMDYTRNNSMGYPDPAGGNLTATMQPALDNLTASLQYMQWGQEITALQLANSPQWAHIGPDAKALAAEKMLQRRAECEEYYFCRGDGNQTIADVTATATAPVVGVETTVTCAGTRDGFGSYILGVNQQVRIMTSGMVEKSRGTITAKANNTSFGFTPSNVTTNTILDTDKVLPQSDATTPTTVGVKGLLYLVKASGNYFNRSLSTITALQAIIDSATTTFTRTTMEALYRNSKGRMGKNPKQRCVTGSAQYSNYYAQFYAQNSAQVNIVGSQLPKVDVGAAGTMDQYTFWGQKIDEYYFIHPKNWWLLDYSTFSRMTLKTPGPLQTPAGSFIQKISGGVYANAQQSWDDDFLEYLSERPFMNAGFTNLAFAGLPGLPAQNPYTGS